MASRSKTQPQPKENKPNAWGYVSITPKAEFKIHGVGHKYASVETGKIIDGFFEVKVCKKKFTLFCDEEGYVKELQPNVIASMIFGIFGFRQEIVGPVLIGGPSENEDEALEMTICEQILSIGDKLVKAQDKGNLDATIYQLNKEYGPSSARVKSETKAQRARQRKWHFDGVDVEKHEEKEKREKEEIEHGRGAKRKHNQIKPKAKAKVKAGSTKENKAKKANKAKKE